MFCARCNTELIAGKAFCHGCGAPVSKVCPKCGASLEARFRFCPDCGFQVVRASEDIQTGAESVATGREASTTSAAASPHPIPDSLVQEIRAGQGVIEGERKVVTVLFCDLAGSTAIAERLDPEEYRELLEQYLSLASRAVHGFEGIVNQVSGDGVMALFGAPIAHEDAPERAVWAALAIQEEFGRLNERLEARHGPELRARIGIHTGPVVVGTVGNELKMDYTAIGDTTNLASRLESLAPPGSILVSEETHALVRGFFEMRPAGPFAVKGKRALVVAYQVLGRREAVTPIAIAAERGLTPLVGRAEELAQLEACYQRVKRNLPQVLALVGESGSGRSRLLHEFKLRLGGEPVVLEARCSGLNQRVPYYPWIAILRQYFEIAPGDTAAAACEKVRKNFEERGDGSERAVPLLCGLLGLPAEGLDNLSPDERKRETFEAIARLFISESERAPLIIVIEDLHWIDEPSREMLERAVADLGRERMMFFVTHRLEYQASWRTSAAFTQLNLRRLSDESAIEIVHAVAGGPLPRQLEQMILTKAEGSPFFAEEITRALMEGGLIERENGRQRLTRPVEDIRIPGTVQEVIAARLDRLEPDSKRVVQVAAVMGRQFSRDQLVQLLQDDAIDVDSALANLEQRGVIHRANLFSNDAYRFGESLTQEVAYEGLLRKQRRELHGRVGALLEGTPGEETAERSSALAHHYVQSENSEGAARALLRAAQEAEKVPSYSSAARFYREAWELTEPDFVAEGRKPAHRLGLDAAVGLCRMTVLYNVPQPADLGRVAERACDLAKTLAMTESHITLSTYRGMLMLNGGREEFAEGLKIVEQALAAAEQAGLSLPALPRALAWAYMLDGRFEIARRMIEWAMEEMRRRSEYGPLSDVYIGSLHLRDRLRYHSDDLEGAHQGAAATHELAVKAANRTVQAGAAGTLARVHFVRGEYEEAKRWAERAAEMSRAVGNLVGRQADIAVIVASRAALGETVSAARYPELTQDDLPVESAIVLAAPTFVAALLAIGEDKRARRYAQRAHDRAGGRLRVMLSALALGEALRHAGPERWAQAERCYAQAIELAETLDSRVNLAAARLGAAELAIARGSRSEGGRHLGHALKICRDLGLGRYQVRVEELLAVTEGSLGSEAGLAENV